MKTSAVNLEGVLIFLLFFAVFSLFAGSNVVTAQGGGNPVFEPLQASFNSLAGLVNTGSVVAVGLAFLFFFWNLGQFILSADDEAKKNAKLKMGWGIIAIFVITAIWGIVYFIGQAVGVRDTDPRNLPIPGVETPQYSI